MDLRGGALDDVCRACWAALELAVVAPGHAMRTGVLATSAGGRPQMRTVVLRRVDAQRRIVGCHTDRRTAKAAEIAAEGRIAWLFFDPSSQTQLRLAARAEVVTDASRIDRYWDSLPRQSHANYLTQRPPATPVDAWTTDLDPSAFDADGLPSGEASASAKSHFALIESVVEHIDWVLLCPDGNARAQFDWQDDAGAESTNGGWRGRWVVP